MSGIRTLIIDNYDSFTFNLYQLIGQANGEEPVVIRNDQLTWEEISGLAFDNIVLSPGPGSAARPEDFGVCGEAILRADVPVLGVCLGHQGIGLAYGGAVRHAPQPMHGRVSAVRHDGSGLFVGIPQRFRAVRYHSLMVAPELPECLQATAWADDGMLMGIAHRDLPRYGIQFHPESVATEFGDLLLKNFRDMTPRRSTAGFAKNAIEASVVPHPPVAFKAAHPHRVYSRKIAFDAAQSGAAFRRLYGDDTASFWLDSSRTKLEMPGEPGIARFSFMGGSAGPLSAFVTYDTAAGEVTVVCGGERKTIPQHIYDFLSDELRHRKCESPDLPFDFNCGFAGYFGYELKPGGGHNSEHPDAAFLLADRLIAIDHEENAAWLVSYGAREDCDEWIETTAEVLAQLVPEGLSVGSEAAGAEPESLTLRLARTREKYLEDIGRCLEYIRDGESYEICLTNRITTGPIHDPLAFYLKLRRMNPAPYAAFLRFGPLAVLSCSPERFLKLDRGGIVESKPIKGTRPRGKTPEEDEALRRDLGASEKDRSENLMITDLLRNDLGMVSELGSVNVPKLMDVETHAAVHQLVSTVRGQVRPGIDAVDCVRAAFPGGSMTGAPKLRTMRLIDELEDSPRGVYSGSIGFLALNGTADLNIVIRTLVATEGETTLGIGGAVVALSNAEAEFEESLVKARALIEVVITSTRGRADGVTVEKALEDLRKSGYAEFNWGDQQERNAAPYLYAVSLPERAVRSASAIVGGVLRELSLLVLPEKVRNLALYRATAGVGLRLLTEKLGDVRGIYAPSDLIARGMVPRYAVGTGIELMGILTFNLSPVWVLAALGDVTRVGKSLFTEIGNSLKAEGLLDPDIEFENVAQLLDGLEKTSTHLAMTVNLPPLDVAGLRREWEEFRANLSLLPAAQLPKAGDVQRAWNNLQVAAGKVQQSVFNVSSAMAVSSLSSGPKGLEWFSRSAVTAGHTTGVIVSRAFLDHYAAASKEMAATGFTKYWSRHSRPYLAAALRNFLPEQRSWTERLLTRRAQKDHNRLV